MRADVVLSMLANDAAVLEQRLELGLVHQCGGQRQSPQRRPGRPQVEERLLVEPANR